MIKGKRTAVVVAAVMMFHGPVKAASGATPDVSLNGFGTLGVVHSDESKADFVSSTLSPDGVGQSGAWSTEVDSRFGLQATADFTPTLSGIVQVITEQRYDDTFAPDVEWANLKLDVTPDLNVRAGRMVLPSFMVSEYRKVGYANPWVRPPSEVYGLVPVTNFDGVELSYRFHFNAFTDTLRGTYGRKDSHLAGGESLKARRGVTVVNTLERGASSLFAEYSRFELTLDSAAPLFNGFRQFGPAGRSIADRYDVDGTPFRLMGIGARYDPGEWFVTGEWARLQSRSFVGTSHGWYITGGYRYGPVTPYLTLARVDVDSNTSDPGLSLAGLPAAQAATAAGLNDGLNELLGEGAAQKSLSVGARWDFHRSMDLKVQLDYLDLDAGSRGVLVNERPGFRRGGSVTLFSVAFDFVF